MNDHLEVADEADLPDWADTALYWIEHALLVALWLLILVFVIAGIVVVGTAILHHTYWK